MLIIYNSMLYDIKSNSKPNILLVSVAAMFGFLVIIIGYYIFASKSPESRRKLFKNNNNNNYNNNNIDIVASNNIDVVALNNIDVVASNDNDDLPQLKLPGSEMPLHRKKNTPVDPQVFNISENVYSYRDAEAACKVFDAELATIEQLADAYVKGADWCNYGWLKGKLAYYPTQEETWKKIQENEPGKRDVCGNPGLNGGDFSSNPNMLFGVNCYGYKPEPREFEKVKQKVMSDKDIRIAEKVAQLRRNKDSISILPFNENKWSGCEAN